MPRLLPCLLAPVIVLTGVGAPALAAPAPARYHDCLVLFNGLDLQTVTVPQLQAAMGEGRFTSRQLTQAYLARIRAYDHGRVQINAIRSLSDDVLKQAGAADAARLSGRRGPMLGIPVLLKDNVDTIDADTTAGSIALAGNRPARDATLVTELRTAGAVLLGKTNLSEFANWMSLGMPNGFSSLGGQVVAPYNQGDPSGSSSGSAAGGTLAFAAVTIGTETSGSILSPSQVNSMVGLKPTVGLVSRKGVIPLAHSFDTAGPIARNVTDAATLLSAISRPDSSDVVNQRAPGGPPPGHDFTRTLRTGALQGARLGYSTADEPTDPASAKIWDAARSALVARGATLIVTDTLSTAGSTSLTEIAGIPSEFKAGLGDYLATQAGPVGPQGRPALVTNDLTGVIVYNQQHSAKIPYGQNLLEASDLTAGATVDDPSSTATILAARLIINKTLATDSLDAYIAPDVAYAGSGAAAGYPSITVPTGYTPAPIGTAPHGIQFLGGAWSEPRLIGLAYDYEQATHARVPATVHDPAITSGSCAASTVATVRADGATGAGAGSAVADRSPSLPATGLPLRLAELGALLLAGTALVRRAHRTPRRPQG